MADIEIHLIHGPSGRYVSGPDGWTLQASEALRFEQFADAVEFCKKRDLGDMVLFFQRGDLRSEYRIPIERVKMCNEEKSWLEPLH